MWLCILFERALEDSSTSMLILVKKIAAIFSISLLFIFNLLSIVLVYRGNKVALDQQLLLVMRFVELLVVRGHHFWRVFSYERVNILWIWLQLSCYGWLSTVRGDRFWDNVLSCDLGLTALHGGKIFIVFSAETMVWKKHFSWLNQWLIFHILLLFAAEISKFV